MATFTVVLADPADGQAYQLAVDGQAANRFVGRSIGDEIDGDALDLSGYTIEITGGSDDAGRPMHPNIRGPALQEILTTGGIGYSPSRDGERRRVTVRGNEISEATVQINATVAEFGDDGIVDLLEGDEDEDE